jgi:hypothetical protein
MKTLWRVHVPDSIRDLMNKLERRDGSFYLRLLPYHYRYGDDGRLNEEVIGDEIRNGVETLGVLLTPKEHEQLIEWWKEAMAVRKRGNPGKAPQRERWLEYLDEYYQERDAFIRRTGKVRGANKYAIAKMAERYNVEVDTMRKRLKSRF